MNYQPLISVLIATYNRQDVLPRAVNSVLKQSYRNIEVIIVDDGSNDDTKSVANSFNDSRIRYVRQESNRGFACSVNTAFKNSTGKYIAIIGDDDEWYDRDKLTKELDVFLKNRDKKIGVVCTGFQLISERDNSMKRVVIPKKPKNLKEYILIQNGIIASTTMLMPSYIWKEFRGHDERMVRGVDSDLFRRLIFKGYEVYFIPEIMVNVYVERNDRMTPIETIESINNCINMEKYKLEKFEKQYNFFRRSKSAVLRKIGRYYLKKKSKKNARVYFLRAFKSGPRSIKNIMSLLGLILPFNFFSFLTRKTSDRYKRYLQ